MQITSSQAVSAQQALSGQNNTTNKELDRDAFLKLLTTQMQAQDPLNPMDNTQFVAQLSQFTSLERLEGMSRSLETLAMSTASNTSAQMVSFIGKQIDLPRATLTLDPSLYAPDSHTPARLELAEDVSQVTISVKDESGKIVRTIEMGRHESGEDLPISWDGLDDQGSPLPKGNYSLSVEALNEEGDRVDAQLITTRRVAGVSFDGGIPRLEIEGLEDEPASLGEVRQVTQNDP